ncbi:MAG: hypothetical protein NXI30_18850 [bacterium]|nr:hypothetical protein [bacterium]
MLGWAIIAGVGIAGFVVLRSWRKDLALKSGEVMDVRNVLPDGQGDCLVRVLSERLYRVELQVEGTLSSDEAASFPCRLTVFRSSDDGGEAAVWDGTRPLVELLPLAAGTSRGPSGSRRVWGSLPVLEFSSDALARFRFEVELTVVEVVDGREIARLDKANLVVKENVRALPAPRKLVERAVFANPHPV